MITLHVDRIRNGEAEFEALPLEGYRECVYDIAFGDGEAPAREKVHVIFRGPTDIVLECEVFTHESYSGVNIENDDRFVIDSHGASFSK